MWENLSDSRPYMSLRLLQLCRWGQAISKEMGDSSECNLPPFGITVQFSEHHYLRGTMYCQETFVATNFVSDKPASIELCNSFPVSDWVGLCHWDIFLGLSRRSSF